MNYVLVVVVKSIKNVANLRKYNLGRENLNYKDNLKIINIYEINFRGG